MAEISLDLLRRKLEESRRLVAELESGGGGGHNGGMEARIAKLEAAAEFTTKRLDGMDKRLERIDADLRLLLGALVAAALGLAAMMAKGFHWIG